jgi:hypothetical protein
MIQVLVKDDFVTCKDRRARPDAIILLPSGRALFRLGAEQSAGLVVLLPFGRFRWMATRFALNRQGW